MSADWDATIDSDGRIMSACTTCREPIRVVNGGAYHVITGTVSCDPVVDGDGGWAEPWEVES